MKDSSSSESKRSDPSKKKLETSTRSSSDKKEQDPYDLDSLKTVIKKLSNEIVDLKRNSGEGSLNSNRGYYRPPFRRHVQNSSNNHNPPAEGLNIEELKEILTTILARIESEEKQEIRPESESGDVLDDEEDKPPEMINHFASSQHGEDLDLEVESVHVNQHPYNTRSRDATKTASTSQNTNPPSKSKDTVTKQNDQVPGPKTVDHNQKNLQVLSWIMTQ